MSGSSRAYPRLAAALGAGLTLAGLTLACLTLTGTPAHAQSAAPTGAGAWPTARAGRAPHGDKAAGGASAANSYVDISGSGSSWAAVAIDEWTQAVRPNGIVVNYNPDGSAAGRADYIENQDDFAGSDPPFRNGADELAGSQAGKESPEGFSYVPDVAGGTAFIYHLEVAGHLITNLRLSPATIMGIFTGKITNWNDKQITKDYGAQLPSLPITPVLRSDGSGATYFFTRWMEHLYPSQWNAFCQQVHPGIQLPCPQTEFYPVFGDAKAENGSNNVITYITSTYGNGSIGYDEYAYALNSHYPVVKVLNPGGYFVLPSASNVAVALTHAKINEDASSSDFLQQDLDPVYTFKDPRSYPLASYSYFIVPREHTKEPKNFNAAKGKTLSTWLNYDLCNGQRTVAQLGYSPLPINLVKGGLLQIDHIPGHVAEPPAAALAKCGNPTFKNGQNILLKDAPYPSACDKLGAPLNCTTSPGKGSSSPTPSGSSTASPGATSTGSTGTGTDPSTGTTGGAVPGGTVPGGTAPAVGPAGSASPQVVSLSSADKPSQISLGVLTALAILAAVAIPPALAIWARRRRRPGL
jgi:ABC-type phosphate transport system substrate-binding protein